MCGKHTFNLINEFLISDLIFNSPFLVKSTVIITIVINQRVDSC